MAVVSAALVAVPALASCGPGWPGAPPSSPAQQTQQGGMMGGQGGMMGGQGGMMGGQGGMVGGQGGMVGGQGGMVGGQSSSDPQVGPVTLDQAADAVDRYLNSYGSGLVLKDVVEFAQNFHAQVEEIDAGVNAMELLVDRYTGQVSPEPTTVWNARYGMMGGYSAGGAPVPPMAISPEQAKALAQEFLDSYLPGLTAAPPDTFHGYYTLRTLKSGQVEGMLSVNGYTGAAWYHTWHGPFIGATDLRQDSNG